MVEKGLIPTDDDSFLPRYVISEQGDDIFYEGLDGERVGKFEWCKLWKRLFSQKNSIAKEPLAKAIGLKNLKNNQLIWDMSCGTGKDTLLLLKFGGIVQAFERNQQIFDMLLFHQYLMEDFSDFPSERLNIFLGAPLDLPHMISPQVIYFDPMYGDSASKKAAPRAQMAMFRDFVGEDVDFLEHLEFALNTARERVVLKRSIKSPILSKERFSHSIFGKSTRYDIYINHQKI